LGGDRDKVTALLFFLGVLFAQTTLFRVMTFWEHAEHATPARSIVEVDRERADQERARREAEAREHPLTKMVLRTFDAEIKEIKTDG
jgi:hypothetical protein